jgi:putative DNA primase/helicase
MIFTYRRPLIINGIEELPIRPDLLDRSVLIHVEPISEDRRRDEQNFWQDFETVRPQLLGRMLDVICEGLRRLPEVKLASSPRMADFARWGVAVEQAMGFDEGLFMAAYQSNREDANAAAIESSPIAVALHHYLADRRSFDGTALKLLDELRKHCESFGDGSAAELRELLHHPMFPKSPNQLSAEIARIEPNLKKLNIIVERGRTHKGRYLKIERTDLRDDDARRDDAEPIIDTPQAAVTVGL